MEELSFLCITGLWSDSPPVVAAAAAAAAAGSAAPVLVERAAGSRAGSDGYAAAAAAAARSRLGRLLQTEPKQPSAGRNRMKLRDTHNECMPNLIHDHRSTIDGLHASSFYGI